MKNCILMLCLFNSLVITGCKPKYVELKKGTFAALKFSEVKEVDIISTGVKASKNSADWKGIYRNVFPIKNPDRINTIIDCIKNKSSFHECLSGHETPFNKIIFKTNKTIYYIGVWWDDEGVYGDWWESPALLNNFKEWGFKTP